MTYKRIAFVFCECHKMLCFLAHYVKLAVKQNKYIYVTTHTTVDYTSVNELQPNQLYNTVL